MKSITIIILFLLCTGIAQGNDKGKIVIEAYINNAPFSHLNGDREVEGFCIDVAAAVMDELGREYRHKKTALCQKRIYSETEKLDVVSFVTEAELVDGWYLSRPYLATKYRIVYQKGAVIVHPKDLVDKNIVVIRGRYSNSHLSIRNARYIPEVTFMSDVTEGLRLLSMGEVDVAIVLQGNNERLVIDEEFDNLMLDEAVLPVREYCFASKDSMLIKDLNRAIDVLKADGTLDAVYDKWFLAVASEKSGNSLPFILIIIVIVIIFTVAILRLGRKIRKSAKEAKLAKTVLQKYAKTINNLSNSYISIFLTDLKHNERSIFKKEKYKLIENGLATFLESIHPEDREFYLKERQLFISGKSASAMIHVRMLDVETDKYNLHELVLNPVARDKAGKVYKFTTIVRNETLQDEMIYKQSKDIHNLNMAMNSVKLIRWDVDIINSIIKLVNIDNKEYVYTNKELVKKIASKDYKQVCKLIAQIKSSTKIDTITVDIDLFDRGWYQSYEVMTTVERNENGSPYAVYGIVRDVTEERLSREHIVELKTSMELALGAGDVSAWTYRCADGVYALLNGYDRVLNIATNHKEVVKTFHPDDIEVMENAIKAIETRESEREVFIIRTLIDNQLATNKLTIIPREQDGEVKHIIGVTKDISEKIKRDLEIENINILLEEKNVELNYNVTLLKEIIDSLPGAVYIKEINSNLKYYLANDNFCKEIANRPISEIIGYYDSDLLPKELAEQCCVSDNHCIEMNCTTESDEEVTFNGVKFVWRTVKTPVSLTNDMKLLICMSLDVTELYRMKEKAEQSDKLKSQFLENMSHEIRTPLNAIVGFSSMLISTDEEETREEFNNIIMANSELLLNLINDVLDLSKMESGIVSFKDEFFNVNALLEETHLSFSLRAGENVEVKYEKLDESVNAKIDKMRIRQVLNNYLSNALKFTKSGEIVFGCRVERGGLMVFVKDTGIGISEEDKVKVFKRFEKFDTFAQGTGLGLSICKAFADLKQGEVGFDSVAGEGSHFWMWIPCEINNQNIL